MSQVLSDTCVMGEFNALMAVSMTPPPSQVQFGHAGACANQASETAVAKNKALKEAGAFVPKSFDELGEIIK